MKLILAIILGVITAVIDVVPMLRQKLDKYSIVSAFVFYLVASPLLYFSAIPLPFYLRGGVFYLLLSLPIVIVTAKDDKFAPFIIAGTAIVLGTLVGIAQSMF